MTTFKSLIANLIKIELRVRPNSRLRHELNEFLETPMKVFEARAEVPSKMILASMALPKYYPRVAEHFMNLLMLAEGINKKEEELIHDKSTTLES